jgi:hypothetical protein
MVGIVYFGCTSRPRERVRISSERENGKAENEKAAGMRETTSVGVPQGEGKLDVHITASWDLVGTEGAGEAKGPASSGFTVPESGGAGPAGPTVTAPS